MVRLGEVNPTVWDKVVEYMEFKLQEKGIEFDASDITFNWRELAYANRLEREVFAKYGYFKDIILHPQFQAWKQWFEENVSLELILDEGNFLMPVSVLVIILTMLYSRVTKDAFVLIAAFLFNVNPIYVVITMLVYLVFFSKGLKPKMHRKCKLSASKQSSSGSVDVSSKSDSVREYVSKLNDNDPTVLNYDHVLIGNDISTLYTAALLSRNGHRCLVLEPLGGPIQFVRIEGLPLIPLSSIAVSKADRYQYYFDLVQSKKNRDSRINFNILGTEKDGFTHTVLRVLPPPSVKSLSLKSHRGVLGEVVSFQAEDGNVVASISSAATIYDQSSFKNFFETVRGTMTHLHSYLVTKVLGSGKDPQSDTISASKGVSDFTNLCTHNVGDMLDRNFEDCLAHALLNGVTVIGNEENLNPNDASGLGAALFFAHSEQGHYYPSGGIGRIRENLIHAIKVNGGEVLSNINIQNIDIDPDQKKPRAVGVSAIVDGRPIGFHAKESVISGVGVLATFTKLVNSKFITSNTKQRLNSLVESRPKIHVVYVLETSSSVESLGLRSADYYEVGSDYDSMKWLLTKTSERTGINLSSKQNASTKESALIGSYCRISCPSVQDSEWSLQCSGKHAIVVEFELIEPAAVWKPYKFPKQSDDTTDTLSWSDMASGPKLFVSSYSEDSKANSFSNSLGDELILSKTQADRIVAVADSKLRLLYPRVFEATCTIARKLLVQPRLGGFRLASTPSKYGAKISSPTDIHGLYLCGRDVSTTGLMGDIQGAWTASNSVLGYSMQELLIGRNYTSDLENIPIQY